MAIPSQTIRSCSTSAPQRVLLSAFLSVILLLPAGCGFRSTVNGIPDNDARSVREGNKAVVLFRLAPRLDNTPVTSIDKVQGLDLPFQTLHANIDQRETPVVSQTFSPSAEAAAENWVSYLIPPGKYWTGFEAPSNATRWIHANSRRNHFFLEVPEGVPLLYAGTLSYTCESRWTITGRMAGFCDNVLIKDESVAAGIVARRDLVVFGPMETILLRPMTWKHVAWTPATLAPMGVILNGSNSVSTPGWKARGIGRATGFGSETVTSLLSEPPSQGTSLSSFEARAYLGYFLYLPFGTVAGLIGGEHSDQKWSPCMKTIAEEVVNWSPPDALRAELVDALARHGVNNVIMVDNLSSVFNESGQPRVRTLFEVEIQEVVFRECGNGWTFCGEMKVRGRLRDMAKDRTLYDGTLIYSNDSRRILLSKLYTRPYEWFVYSDAACRPIERYCAPEGAKLFVGDLEAEVQFLAERLLEEAGISPPGDEKPRSFNMQRPD